MLESYIQFGLKLGSKETNYTKDILSFYDSGYFQYMELFAVPESFNDTIEYWKQFSIPIIIHAPHSFAGMNISLLVERKKTVSYYMKHFISPIPSNLNTLFFIPALMVILKKLLPSCVLLLIPVV